MVTAYGVVNPVAYAHFGGPIAPIPFTDVPIHIAITAFVINAVASVVLTLVFRAVKLRDGHDATTARDYGADEHDPKVQAMPDPLTEPVI